MKSRTNLGRSRVQVPGYVRITFDLINFIGPDCVVFFSGSSHSKPAYWRNDGGGAFDEIFFPDQSGIFGTINLTYPNPSSVVLDVIMYLFAGSEVKIRCTGADISNLKIDYNSAHRNQGFLSIVDIV